MKTFRLIGKMILAVLIMASVTACSDGDDDDDNPNTGNQSEKLIKKITEDYGSYYQLAYSGKKLSSFKYYDWEGDLETNITFSYSGNTATMSERYDEYEYKVNFKLNDKGYITSISDAGGYIDGSCTYNSDGYITKLTSSEDDGDYYSSNTTVFTYANGNRTKAVETSIDEEDEYTETRIYTYNEYENKSMLNFVGYDEFDYFLYTTTGFLGKAPKNLVSKVEITTDNYWEEDRTYYYTYELDEEGYVTKIHEREVSSGWDYTETYVIAY